MKIHHLKIINDFALPVLTGNKTFEVRYNDRDYQVGDLVEFEVHHNGCVVPDHPLSNITFVITYVLPHFGLEPGFVCFSLRPLVDFAI